MKYLKKTAKNLANHRIVPIFAPQNSKKNSDCMDNKAPKPYTKDEINAMMDLAEQQFETGEYSDDNEVFDRLYKKYGLKGEEVAA